MNVSNPIRSEFYPPSGLKSSVLKPDGLKRDIALFFTTRIIRLFAYGFLCVVMVLYLSEIGFKDHEIGLLLSLTLLGDVASHSGLRHLQTVWVEKRC